MMKENWQNNFDLFIRQKVNLAPVDISDRDKNWNTLFSKLRLIKLSSYAVLMPVYFSGIIFTGILFLIFNFYKKASPGQPLNSSEAVIQNKSVVPGYQAPAGKNNSQEYENKLSEFHNVLSPLKEIKPISKEIQSGLPGTVGMQDPATVVNAVIQNNNSVKSISIKKEIGMDSVIFIFW